MNDNQKRERLQQIFESDLYLLNDDPKDVVTFVSCEEDTLLHLGAYRGDMEAVELLVALGSDVNALGDMGYTPLHLAAIKGHHDIYDYLVSCGADPQKQSEFGTTCVDEKDRRARKQTRIKEIFREDISHLSKVNNFDALKISFGKDSLLHIAAERGNLEAVELLVELGCDRHALGNLNYTPLLLAAKERHKNVYDYLFLQKDISGVLHVEVSRGNMDAIKFLLELGFDINEREYGDNTPLHRAAWRGRNEVYDYLLAHGADASIKNDLGKTAAEIRRWVIKRDEQG